MGKLDGNIALVNGESIGSAKAAAVPQRVGTLNEIIKPVIFLTSNDSSYITGIELFVDDGVGQI